jgi:Carboxypeptidase regulatory-like domain
MLAQDTLGTIEGTVTGTSGKPFGGAAVTVLHTRSGANTDTLGHYTIRGIPTGIVTVVARAFASLGVTRDSVRVTQGVAARVDFVLQSETRRQVWLHCIPGLRTPDGGICLHARLVGSLGFNTPPGIGIVRDPDSWNALRASYPPFAFDTVPSDSARVDWSREVLLVVSYNSWDADDGLGFNRAEVKDGVLVIVTGPDSLVGPKRIFLDSIVLPAVFAIPKLKLPIRYETRVADSPQMLDIHWDLLARPAPR